MKRSLTKLQAKAFRQRWQSVNAREVSELREASPELRWRQLNSLLGWTQTLGWTEALREGEAEVRRRWIRLRKALGG
jgi:hypothetical protein